MPGLQRDGEKYRWTTHPEELGGHSNEFCNEAPTILILDQLVDSLLYTHRR